ncbi:MAG: PAS domain S-box protein [Anaerolineae bacterium]|nr:PAS domain S-box protein [Anaerolineae bacterium]
MVTIAQKSRQRVVRLYAVIAAVGAAILFVVVLSFETGIRLNTKYASQIEATFRIKEAVLSAHLWLEELASGDTYIDIKEIRTGLDRASALTTALLEGGAVGAPGRAIVAVDDRDARRKVEDVQKALTEFKDASEQRYAAGEEAGADSEVDDVYDQAAKDLSTRLDLLMWEFEQISAQELDSLYLLRLVVIGAVVAVFGAGAWMLHSYEQRSREDLESIQEHEQQLTVFRALIETAGDAICLADLSGNVVYANPAFYRMHGYKSGDVAVLDRQIASFIDPEDYRSKGLSQEQIVAKATSPDGFMGEWRHVRRDKSTFIGQDNAFTIRDENNQAIALGEIVRDVTIQKQTEIDRQRLQQETIEAQREAILELSSPIIPLMEGIIVMPLIGDIDTSRARDITRALLDGIGQYRAKVVILDITGVQVVDTGVANHLNKTVQAARLKGAQTILTGISDAVAETIVDLGIDWSKLATLRNLQAGLLAALRSLGMRIESGKTPTGAIDKNNKGKDRPAEG